jgi:hypothetical protein
LVLVAHEKFAVGERHRGPDLTALSIKDFCLGEQFCAGIGQFEKVKLACLSVQNESQPIRD